MIDSEQVSADLFNTARDPVAVHRLEDIEGLEDHKRQRALLDVCLLFSWLYILAANRKDATVPVGKQQEIELPRSWPDVIACKRPHPQSLPSMDDRCQRLRTR